MSHEVNPLPVTMGLGAQLRGNIATVRKLLDDLIEGEVRALNLTLGEADVLTVTQLSRSDPPAPKLLAEWLSLTTAGIAGRLNSLEAKGLIERRPHHSDGRRLTVHLTAAGEEMATKILDTKDTPLAELLIAEIGRAKSEALNASLDDLIRVLRSHLDAGA